MISSNQNFKLLTVCGRRESVRTETLNVQPLNSFTCLTRSAKACTLQDEEKLTDHTFNKK